jgi:hypothetical protein
MSFGTGQHCQYCTGPFDPNMRPQFGSYKDGKDSEVVSRKMEGERPSHVIIACVGTDLNLAANERTLIPPSRVSYPIHVIAVPPPPSHSRSDSYFRAYPRHPITQEMLLLLLFDMSLGTHEMTRPYSLLQ